MVFKNLQAFCAGKVSVSGTISFWFFVFSCCDAGHAVDAVPFVVLLFTTPTQKPAEDVFDKVNPSILNASLKEGMPGLSAKVFRTYNASITLEKELADIAVLELPNAKKNEYDRANREVAILCNHQRTVSKSFQATFDKMTVKVR